MDEFDIIFAGGGTTACVAAGRLAAAAPSLKILILEAGEHTYGLQAHIQPARYASHIIPTSKTVTFNVAKPSKDVGSRSIVVPSGRCVGGGSSVNFAMYTRAAASDYDDWETIYHNPGWGSADLLPLLKKCETYQAKAGLPTHGYSGPLKVSFGGAFTDAGKQFLDIATKYDHRRGHTDDANGLYQCNVYGRWEKWISADSGKRSDAAHHYIYNQKHNKNLQVLDGCRVSRVIFENQRAVGVEYVDDIVTRLKPDQKVHTARASRLVVVSAGAFGSPTILERSGVGARDLLQKLGVEVVADLPGVGESYQDHNGLFVPYNVDQSTETLDGIFRGEKFEDEKWSDQWHKDGTGLLAHNGIDAGIKLRPNAEDLKELGPEFKARWEAHFKNAPDKPVIWLGTLISYVGTDPVPSSRKFFSTACYTEYPVARGSVHATSTDPQALHDFQSGFLRDPADVAVLRWGYKRSREFARRLGVYRGDYIPGHPAFQEGSTASGKDAASGPVPVDAPDIVYSVEDDAAINEYVRNFVTTTWHSLGTCAMKPREHGGVVDSKLNVYGLQNLKIADMSIVPGNVAANTYSTAVVIGEKAALIIAQELGIEGSEMGI